MVRSNHVVLCNQSEASSLKTHEHMGCQFKCQIWQATTCFSNFNILRNLKGISFEKIKDNRRKETKTAKGRIQEHVSTVELLF